MNSKKMISIPVLLIICISVLSACGGGGGSSSDTTSPQVTGTTPANAATLVATDVVVSAEFDEDMLGTTIDDTSFTLKQGGNSVTSTVSFDGAINITNLTPSAPLALLTPYEASLSSAITDLSGNPLATTNWSFTTGDGSWKTATLVETDDTGDARKPQVAFDGDGNAIAVWQQHDGSSYNILSNRYNSTTGSWGSPSLIDGATGDASNPQIAVNHTGDAFAIWHQTEGAVDNIWANRYDSAAGGWSGAVLLEAIGETAGEPQIAIDSAGNALAIWSQFNTGTSLIFSRRYASGSWEAIEIVGNGSGNAFAPQIAFDDAGNAIAVWHQANGLRYDIWSNRYVAGVGWDTEILIEFNDAGSAWSPQIAIHGGNATVVWHQTNGSQFDIWSTHYFLASGWNSTPLKIETDDTGDAYLPQVAMDSAGNALVVWYQRIGLAVDARSNYYIAGTGWESATVIEDSVNAAIIPQIAIDSNGNGMAVWVQEDGVDNIWVNRYLAGTGWAAAEQIETDDSGHAATPQIAIDGDGNALAVWDQRAGSTRDDIFSNHFDW